MASIEFIQKRISGKEAEIAKLQKKLERIVKAESTGWEVNPYYYSERDKRYTTKDLEAAKEALAKYQADLQTAQEKQASRNVTVIIEFLERWKANTTKFYLRAFEDYKVDLAAYYEEDSKYCDWWNRGGYRSPDRKEVEKKHQDYRAAFMSKWSFMRPFVDRQLNREKRQYEEVLDEAKLKKTLDQEADAKYDFIIERTNAIVGKISDASGLKIGAKGDLNGFIIGERGKAKVQTIGAGGWNIQCFHFRTLIHSC